MEAYSGYKANERPVYLIRDGERLRIENIVVRWYGPEHDYFKVVAEDGKVYLIKWHRYLDVWLLENILERIGRH